MRIQGLLGPESSMSTATWFHYVQIEKGEEGKCRAPGCVCAAWLHWPSPGQVWLSYCRREVQTGSGRVAGGLREWRGVSVASRQCPGWPSPAFLCSACPSTHSGHGSALVALAEALPVLDTCPKCLGTHRRCLSVSKMLRDAQGKKGDNVTPYLTVGKTKVIQRVARLFDHSLKAWEPWGVGWGCLGQPCLGVQDTPGSSPSQVSGLQALPKKQAQLAPDLASQHHGPSPPPRLNRHKACDPGPGSQEFLTDAMSPYSRQRAHWLHQGLRGEACLALCPKSPWVSSSWPAPACWVKSQLSSSGCPDPDMIRDNRAIKSWASHFTYPCLSFHICKMGMITAQFSSDCWRTKWVNIGKYSMTVASAGTASSTTIGQAGTPCLF